MRMRTFAFLSGTLPLLALGSASDALAHKMKLFATAEGPVVSGYVYFSPGGRAQDAAVTAATADGTTVFQGHTNEQGEFRFETRRPIDHVIHADGGDGHEADFTIRAAELPDSLSGGAPSPPAPQPAAPAVVAAVAAVSAPAATAGSPADLAALVEQSVARQVRPLREQLDAYEQTVRWHDVIGGLGTIIGFAGLAYGFAARSQARQRRRSPVGKELIGKEEVAR